MRAFYINLTNSFIQDGGLRSACPRTRRATVIRVTGVPTCGLSSCQLLAPPRRQEEARTEVIRRPVFMLPASRFEYTFLRGTQSILGVANHTRERAAAAAAAPAGTKRRGSRRVQGGVYGLEKANVAASRASSPVIMILDYVFLLACSTPPSTRLLFSSKTAAIVDVLSFSVKVHIGFHNVGFTHSVEFIKLSRAQSMSHSLLSMIMV